MKEFLSLIYGFVLTLVVLSIVSCSPAYLTELKTGAGCADVTAPLIYGGGEVTVCRSDGKSSVILYKGKDGTLIKVGPELEDSVK